jgi:hypothetical protein
MAKQKMRLGDLVDDYCPRCKFLLNHAVASLVGDQVAKVICQTCYTEHAFLHGRVPAKKVPGTGKMTLFDQVVANLPPVADPPAKKKKLAHEARYISRHSGKPPRRKK